MGATEEEEVRKGFDPAPGASVSEGVHVAKRGVTETGKAPPKRLGKRGPLAWGNAALQGPALPHALDTTAANRLAVHAVDDSTNKVYVRAVRTFLQEARRCQLRLTSFDDVDKAMAAYMSDLCFLQEAGPTAGSSLLSGMTHCFEELRGHLPRSARCLKAWHGIAAVGEGVSACREVVALVATDMLRHGDFEAGFLVLLSYDLFAREQDWVFLRAEDVAGDGAAVSLLFGRRERGERSKTGFMQGAVVGSPFIGSVVEHLASLRDPVDPLFDLGQGAFRRLWWAALERLGLQRVGPPHRLRHTGAGEFVSRGGSLEQARRRGRWAALGSVQRYTKTHFVVRSRASLTEAQRREGERFWVSIEASVVACLPKAGPRDGPVLAALRWAAKRNLPPADPAAAPHMAAEEPAERSGGSSSRPSPPAYDPEFRPHAGGWSSH